MKCELIVENIDRLIFESNSSIYGEIEKHVETCVDCKEYYKQSIETRKLTEILKKQPVLNNPEKLTSDILSEIEYVVPGEKGISGRGKVIRLIKRTLAAASVILVLIFGIEQYVVVESISRLESQNSTVSTENPNISLRKLAIYNSGININSANEPDIKELSLQKNRRKISTQIMLARISSLMTGRVKDKKLNKIFLTVSNTYNIKIKNDG